LIWYSNNVDVTDNGYQLHLNYTLRGENYDKI